MRSLSYLEGFGSTVRRYPDREALLAPEGRSYTYRELDERTDALAAALETRLPGERCGVLSQNAVGVVETMLASMKRGRACVQLSTRGAAGELASMMESGEAAGLVFDEALAEEAGALIDRLDLTVAIGVGAAADEVAGAETYEDVVAGGDPSDVPAGGLAKSATEAPESAVFFTSGTTSAPKAILVDQEQAWLAANQPALEMSLAASDRALVCTPWYHMVTTEAWVLPHLLVGATLVLQPAFDPPETLRLIEEHEITGLLAVPTQLEALLHAQDDVDADLGSVEYVRTGGAVVPESLIETVRERFTEGVFNTYGLTEGVGNLAFAYPDEQLDHPGTIGKSSFLWELRVVEPADPPEKPDPEAVVDPGETGEILGKSLQMATEYIDRPEETEALIVDDPASETSGVTEEPGSSGRWLRTGDVARVDEDGYLTVIDRVDNMILSGGENVYPEEVQHALKDHPGVRDAGVVGLSDETWGQTIAAAVVVEEGVTEDALDAHCRDHDTLADFKRPRRYVVVSELPRTATGTLVREEVEGMFEG